MSQPIQVCSLRRVPEDLIQAARRFALQERPSNAGANDGEDRLAFPIQGMWKPSRELRIRFLHGTPTLQDKIRVCANEWPRYANIKFTWVDSGDTEIRISVGSGGGSWSNLGTDNGTIPQDQKTMNFGWLKEDSPDHDVNRVVVWYKCSTSTAALGGAPWPSRRTSRPRASTSPLRHGGTASCTGRR